MCTTSNPIQLPDVLGERPVMLFGKWRGDARGQVVIEGQSATGPYRNAVAVGPHIGQDTAALRYLWARIASPACRTRRRWKAATASASASPSWACNTTC